MKTDTVLFVIGFILVVCWSIYMLYRLSVSDTNKKSQINVPATKSPRSWAASQLKLEFFAVPVNHRPDTDIESVLNALDTKYGNEDVNQHFRTRAGYAQSSMTAWSWDHNCNTKPCKFQDYYHLHRQIEVLQAAYKKREHALQVAEQQHGFEQMEALKAALTDETLSLKEQTTNITNGV